MDGDPDNLSTCASLTQLPPGEKNVEENNTTRDAEVRFSSVRGRFFPNREPNFGSVRPVTVNAERPVRFGSNARTNRNLPSSLSGRKIVTISNICSPKWKNTDYVCLGLCARVLRCLLTKWHSLQSLGIDGCKPLNLDEVQVISIMYD